MIIRTGIFLLLDVVRAAEVVLGALDVHDMSRVVRCDFNFARNVMIFAERFHLHLPMIYSTTLIKFLRSIC